MTEVNIEGLATRHVFHLECGGRIAISEVNEEQLEKLKDSVIRGVKKEMRKKARNPPLAKFYDP